MMMSQPPRYCGYRFPPDTLRELDSASGKAGAIESCSDNEHSLHHSRQSFCRLVTMPMDYLLTVDASGLNGYPGAPFSMSGASVVILSLSGKSTPKALVSFADP